MRKIASIVILLLTVLSCSKQDLNLYEEEGFAGVWKLEEKLVNNKEVALNGCNHNYGKLLILDKENSRWVYCYGEIVDQKIGLNIKKDGNFDMFLYEDLGRTLLNAKIVGNVFTVTYKEAITPDDIRVDKFRKVK